MFTGLVEGRGTVSAITFDGPAIALTISPPPSLASEGAAIGDSIAVSGCCLTLVDVDASRWTFEAGEETLSKTSLGHLTVGDPVNLERALPANGRLGGHFVQGHVDATGNVERVLQDDRWTTMWFRVPATLSRMMVPKGSVAVDGVSLTLVDVEPERFSVALIPHTLEHTTLGVRRKGDLVNIETDILGRYVRKFLEDASVQ